ncbi:MAG: M28 family metallopeptidase [Acidobacteriota bacterium]|nr:M28 family metallopeptidase [Acidobacteriota bacterium]
MKNLAVFATVTLTLLGQTPAADPIRGFPQSQWAAEHALEQRAQALPEPDRIRAYMQRMVEVPHHAGSAGSLAVAQYALGLFKEWGLNARMEEFEALLPYPTARTLELVSPVKFRAALKEPALPEDRSTSQAGQLPTYNAYSAAGDVTAPLVYVNYGTPEDYEYLGKQGIDVKGKIVIARYGKSWRGVKPKVAAEHGAVACLIYSDPRDDGYYQGDVYPKGALRPPQGAQRGSVMDMAVGVGDPLSPGWASEKGGRRLQIGEAKTLMKIPVMPISYADATPLLQNLEGPVAPEAWRGALPFTYHIGPGPATAHFKLDFDNSTRPLHDVIATIPGSAYPDEWIVIGNHHDAWVNGAHDPLSGATALLETARALALLNKQGWQPKRTIVFALWDGEEFGLIGSTEWVEKHQSELAQKAVVYINSDTNSQGNLSVSGSHTLETFMSEVLRDLKEPGGSGKSLLESTRSRPRIATETPGEQPQPGFHLGPLGAGSDYVAFIDHVGVASLNLGFGGPNQGGVYHSIYDDFEWFTRFGDPGFKFGKALAQITLTTLLRLSDAPVLPFEFGNLARTVRLYVDEIKKQSGAKVDFQPVLAQLDKMDAAAKSFEQALQKATGDTAKANRVLFQSERALVLDKGLPGRDWYRHQLYAPGMYTGYGAKTLPGIREAVEGSRWEEANREAVAVASVLEAMNRRIDEATRLLAQ